MIPEKLLEFLCLDNIINDFYNINLDDHDTEKIYKRYEDLRNEFLSDYALNTTEKSE